MDRLQLRTGGQTGVDRAALDAAIARGVDYSGWCPRGGWAEDFPTPPGLLEHYPKLTPTPSPDPAQRTAWNVRDSHAVLTLTPHSGYSNSPGTSFGRRCAELVFLRPGFSVDLGDPDLASTVAWVRAVSRLAQDTGEGVFVLGVGGPRESEVPGIYEKAHRFMVRLLEQIP